MIYALEGPDKAGKTTLFDVLRQRVHAVFVPRLPMVKALAPVIREVEIRNEALWRALYDPERIYVCDRHFSVSDRVYSRLYKRELADYSYWLPRVCPLYLRVPVTELVRRHEAIGDEFFDLKKYSAVCKLYEKTIRMFPKYIAFNGTLPVERLADKIAWWIKMGS